MIRAENISLKEFNTFGIGVKCRYFFQADEDRDIQDFLTGYDPAQGPLMILGGGSNVLFTGDFGGTILRICTKGIHVVSEDDDSVLVSAAAGERWDDLVDFCVERGWSGIENLSLIPGNAGTAPVQNIGAYGVEMKDVFHELEATDLKDGSKKLMTAYDCRFGYRDSIFKNELKGRMIITSVTFRLSKEPALNLSYGNIREELTAMNVMNPDIRAVREAVIHIRRRKLPDPAVTGNAGSFFKNPVIHEEKFMALKERFPGISFYPQEDGCKISAAWLIEQCGWKGKRTGDAGVNVLQPLVLVNYGQATGRDIIRLAEDIKGSVREMFGIKLETEVNII